MMHRPTRCNPSWRSSTRLPPKAVRRHMNLRCRPAADFNAIVIAADNVSEDADGQTAWAVSRPLQGTTRYWWRARVKQGSNTGPWSTPTRFKSRIEGFNRPGELFNPLTNGSTVGTLIDSTLLPGQGVRLDSLGSRVTYNLPQNLPEGEISVLATGLNSNSAGDSTKLFNMQHGSTDMTTNPCRATIEKRDHGTVTFRFIAGDVDARADGTREDYVFNPALLFLLHVLLGQRLSTASSSSNLPRKGAPSTTNGDSSSGTYPPTPQISPSRSPTRPGRHQHRPQCLARSSAMSGFPAGPNLRDLAAHSLIQPHNQVILNIRTPQSRDTGPPDITRTGEPCSISRCTIIFTLRSTKSFSAIRPTRKRPNRRRDGAGG